VNAIIDPHQGYKNLVAAVRQNKKKLVDAFSAIIKVVARWHNKVVTALGLK
jgi:hypothetical protein